MSNNELNCETINSKISSSNRLLKFVILIVLLSITYFVDERFEAIKESERFSSYKDFTDKIVMDISMTLKSYTMVMQGGAGVFVASDNVNREEFKTYFNYRRIPSLFPGILGFGYSEVVKPEELEKHQLKIRSQGFPKYKVWPEGLRDYYTAIIYLEPFNEKNQRAFGYDMSSEPIRHEAMTRACDTGEISLSGGVTLVQENESRTQRGFLIYIPIYNLGLCPETVAERRAKLKGYVYAPFRMEDFIHGVHAIPGEKVAFRIYDGERVTENALMYDSSAEITSNRKAHFNTSETISLFGHKWTFVFWSQSALEATFVSYRRFFTYLAGFLISVLAFLLFLSQEAVNNRAVEIAERMTEAYRKTETDLKREKKFSELILNAVGDGIYGLDLQGCATFVNLQAAKMLGYSQEELLGKCQHDMIHHTRSNGDHYTVEESLINQAFEESISVTTDKEVFWKKDGKNFPVEYTISPILDEDSKAVGAVVVFRDITERKEIEENMQKYREQLEQKIQHQTIKLKRSEGQLKSIISNLVYALITINNKGIIETFNPAAEKLFGYKAEEVLGKNVRILAAEPYRSKHDQYLQRYLETKIPHILGVGREVVAQKKDGSEFPADLSVSEFAFEGHIIFTGMIIDISDRKKIEHELISAKEAAETSNRAKSSFLAHMSHEIRTPMNAVLGFAQILIRDNTLSKQQSDYVGMIIRGGNHLLALINDILDISKIEAGRVEVNLKVFNIRDFLDDIKMMFSARAASKNITFNMELGANLPGNIVADSNKLRQILLNLLGNAVKFTETGGVALRVQAKTPDGQAKENKKVTLVFDIEDTGPGISDTDFSKLFKTFQQAEAGTKTGGTGLGLAISRGFARIMGGDITVKSEFGKGSCFALDIVVGIGSDEFVQSTTEAPSPITGIESNYGPFKVLLVDDILENRILLRSLLKPVGFQIQEAENGEIAIKKFDEWKPDIVLMDMKMPVMNGYEAIKYLKSRESSKHVPIIAVTASAFEDNKEEIMAIGANDFLRKPFRPEDLFLIIQKHIEIEYIFSELKNKLSETAIIQNNDSIDLSKIGSPLARRMLKAIADGDISELLQIISQFRDVDCVTADNLKIMAENFDYDNLAKLLEEVANSNNS